MTQEGFVLLHRKLLEWEWYDDANTMRLFIHCLLRANHKNNKWQGKIIKKGSFVTSYEKLSIETGLSIQQIRTSIEKLKSTGELTYQSTSQYSIITVNNWDKFQQDNKQNNKQITNNQQTNNKQITTNNNDNNDNNSIINNSIIAKFKKPTLEEIKNYCLERKNNVDAKKFYEYYSLNDWKDKDGKQIKNWKQKIIAVWEGQNKNPVTHVKPKKYNPYYNVYAEDTYYANR